MAFNQPAGRYAHVCPWKHLGCSLSRLGATEDALGGTGRPNVVALAEGRTWQKFGHAGRCITLLTRGAKSAASSQHWLLNGIHLLCVRFQKQPARKLNKGPCGSNTYSAFASSAGRLIIAESSAQADWLLVEPRSPESEPFDPGTFRRQDLDIAYVVLNQQP